MQMENNLTVIRDEHLLRYLWKSYSQLSTTNKTKESKTEKNVKAQQFSCLCHSIPANTNKPTLQIEDFIKHQTI